MKKTIRSFFSAAPKGDATFLSRVTKGLTAAALALATLLITTSAWAAGQQEQDENGLSPSFWYKFNGNLDWSGARGFNTFNPGSTYTAGRDGEANTALIVANGQMVNEPSPASPQSSLSGNGSGGAPFTISVTAKVAVNGQGKVILAMFSHKNNGDAIILVADPVGGAIQVWRAGNSVISQSVSDITTAFHTYVVTGDGSKVTLYVDGVANSTTSSTYPPTTRTACGIFTNGGAGGFYDGLAAATGTAVDDYRIYCNTCLTDKQVKMISNDQVRTATATIADGFDNGWSAVGWSDGAPNADDFATLTFNGAATIDLGSTVPAGAIFTLAGGVAGKTVTFKGSADAIAGFAANTTLNANFAGSVEYVVDATTVGFSADAALLSAIKAAGDKEKFVFLGDGENGATLDFAAMGNGPTLKTHLVFEGGTHTLKYKRADQGFSTTSTAENPVVLVKGNTTLTFNATDLTYWNGGYIAGGIIRVNDGGVLDIADINNGTFYYRQQFYLDPGATMNVKNWSNNQGFRLQGGTGNDVIYVPASAAGNTKVATINGNIHMHTDATIGFGVNVGENSILSIGSMTSYDPNDANYKIVKRGAGKLVAAGDFNINTIEVADGSLAAGGTIKSVTLTKATEIEVAEGKAATISAISGDYSITKTGAGTLNLPNAYAGAITLTEGRVDPTFVGTLTIAGDLAFAANELPLISTFATSGHTGSITLPNGFFGQIAKISGDDKPSDLVIKDSTGTPITEGFAKDTDGYLVLKAEEITTVADVSRPTEFIGAMRFGEGGGVTVKHATPNTPMYYTSDAITVAEGKKAVVTLDLYGQYEVGTEFVMLEGASIPAVECFDCRLGATPAGTTISPSVKAIGGVQTLVFTITSSLLSSQSDATKAALAKAVANFDAGRFETLTLDDAGNVSKWTNLGNEAELYDATPAGNGREANQKPTFAIVDGRPVLDFGECNSQKDLGFTRVAIKVAIQVIQLKNDKRAFYLGDYGGTNEQGVVQGKYSFHRDQSDVNPPLFNTGNAKTFAVYDNGVDRGRGISGTFPETMRVISVATDSDECYTDCFTMDRDNSNQRSGGRKLCETLLFTEELTADERVAIEDYLNAKWGLFDRVQYTGDVAVSTINADVADLETFQIVLDDGATLSVDQAIAKPLPIACDGRFTVVGNGYEVTDADLAKLNLLLGPAVCIFDSGATLPTVAPGIGMTYRYEGTTALTNVPFAQEHVVGALEIACPISADKDGKVSVIRNKNLTFDDGFAINASIFVCGNKLNNGDASPVQQITQNAGTITLTKEYTGTETTGDMPLLFAHWPSTVTYNLVGGSIIAENGNTMFGRDGEIELTVGGGENTATFKTRGIYRNGRTHTCSLTIATNGVVEVGVGGVDFQEAKKIVLAGGTFGAYTNATVSTTLPIEVNADSTIKVAEEMSLQVNASFSGEYAIAKADAGTLILGSAARPKLGAIAAGKVRFVASAEEIADGEIAVPTTEAAYADGLLEVVASAGDPIDFTASVDAETGVLTLTLTTNRVKDSSSVSEWDSTMEGEVAIKGDDPEEELTITVNRAFPEGVTAINVFGKVALVYTDGAAESEIPVNVQPNAVLTLTAANLNPINVQNGGSLVASGTFTTGKQIVSSSTTIESGVVSIAGETQLTGTIIIEKDATLKLARANGISSVVTLHNYGTFDLDEYNQEANSYNVQCKYYLYAGSTIRGGENGRLQTTGGYPTEFYIKDWSETTEKTVTIDAKTNHGSYDVEVKYVIDEGVGFRLLKQSWNNNIKVSGSNVNGLVLDCGKTVTMVANNRCLHGAVAIKAGSTLLLTGDDTIAYDGGNETTLDIAGTLDCAVTRQTIFAANTVTLRDGGKIVGTGGTHDNYTGVFDICNNVTFTVDGFATIEGPLAMRDAGNTLTFVKEEEAEKAVVVVKSAFAGNGPVKANGVVILLENAASAKMPTVADDAESGLVVALSATANYTIANDEIVFTVPADAGSEVDFGSASLKGRIPEYVTTSLPKKFRLKVSNGRLLGKAGGFTLMLK